MVKPPSGSGEIKRISFIHGQLPVAIDKFDPIRGRLCDLTNHQN